MHVQPSPKQQALSFRWWSLCLCSPCYTHRWQPSFSCPIQLSSKTSSRRLHLTLQTLGGWPEGKSLQPLGLEPKWPSGNRSTRHPLTLELFSTKTPLHSVLLSKQFTRNHHQSSKRFLFDGGVCACAALATLIGGNLPSAVLSNFLQKHLPADFTSTAMRGCLLLTFLANLIVFGVVQEDVVRSAKAPPTLSLPAVWRGAVRHVEVNMHDLAG